MVKQCTIRPQFQSLSVIANSFICKLFSFLAVAIRAHIIRHKSKVLVRRWRRRQANRFAVIGDASVQVAFQSEAATAP